MKANPDAPELMPIEQAKKIIHDTIEPITQYSDIALKDALGRIIAKPVMSPINVPAYHNSAVDGYAFNFADYTNSHTFTLIGKSFAGSKFIGTLKQGECVRIMTGAQIPKGANTVVMQENARVSGNQITFCHAAQGDAIRSAGNDINKGAMVLPAGKRVSPIDIGLLASLGLSSIPVYRQLCVAIFSTGDELLSPGDTPCSDRIFDSNGAMLDAMLSRLGAKVINLGIIGDDKVKIRAALEQANQQADCVITSGGVSVGEADYTRDILQEYGTVGFWKLAIKPGKPLAFGRLPNSIFFGLPGNPVSAAVTFDQIAAPALALLAGCNVHSPILLPAKAASDFKKQPGRTDYQRAYYFIDEHGQICVENTGSQSSGVLSCFSSSNCYAILETQRQDIARGETVHILPFSTMFI